jgi:parvulin-like peptidyl-prolyl isomerase
MSVLLAACGSVGERVAATVDGAEITVDDVLAVYPAGEDEDVIASDTFRASLTNVIVGQVILSAAESEFGIEPAEDEIETQYQDFVSQLEATDVDGNYEAALEANGITDARVRQAAKEELVANALQERLAEDVPEVSDEDVEAEFEANDNLYRNACIKHILLETEEEANQVKARLDEGEDFGEVAAEMSIEPQAAETFGDLGCSNLARYVGEFADGAEAAEVGVVTDPVQTEFGWHLILVEEIDDDDTVRQAIRDTLASTAESQYFQDWILDALESADVQVDEDFGTWVTDPQPGIVANEDATDNGTTDTTAG